MIALNLTTRETLEQLLLLFNAFGAGVLLVWFLWVVRSDRKQHNDILFGQDLAIMSACLLIGVSIAAVWRVATHTDPSPAQFPITVGICFGYRAIYRSSKRVEQEREAAHQLESGQAEQ